jgi:hypothetical protein
VPSWTPQTHREHSTSLILYLFLAEDGQMKHNLKRVGIGSDDDEFGDASIECLGGLIGALLDLLQRGALGNEVE